MLGAKPFIGDGTAPEGKPDPPFGTALVIKGEVGCHSAEKGPDILAASRFYGRIDPRQCAPHDLAKRGLQHGILSIEIMGDRAGCYIARPRDIAKPRAVKARLVDHMDRRFGNHPFLRGTVDLFWHNSDYV